MSLAREAERHGASWITVNRAHTSEIRRTVRSRFPNDYVGIPDIFHIGGNPRVEIGGKQ